MTTCLSGFAELFKHEEDWGGIWSLDGLHLNDAQARIFVKKAMEAGYITDDEVPEELVREWLGLPKKVGAK